MAGEEMGRYWLAVWVIGFILMCSMQAETNEQLVRQRRKREPYSKISLQSKLIFFRKVIHEHGDLRDVARRLGIKYSTAKTFTRNYQSLPEEKNTALVDALCALFERRPRTRRRCGYRLLSEESGKRAPNIEIVCSSLSATL